MEVTLAEAQARLSALIAGLPTGGTVVIRDGGRTVATVTVHPAAPPAVRPGYGASKGKIRIIRDDDSHLEDFAGTSATRFTRDPAAEERPADRHHKIMSLAQAFETAMTDAINRYVREVLYTRGLLSQVAFDKHASESCLEAKYAIVHEWGERWAAFDGYRRESSDKPDA